MSFGSPLSSAPLSAAPRSPQLHEDELIPELEAIQKEIASADWTGLATKMSPEHLFLVKEKANALLQAIMQSDADMQSKLDAWKRVEAVIVILDAPNVPWREVVGLLNHPTVTAFLATLNLIQFILGLA